DYPTMIVGVYAVLGVFLLLASRNPLDNLSLIWFTIWSSVVHAAIMTVQALASPGSRGHLIGDVPALFIVAAVLALLTPGREKAALRRPRPGESFNGDTLTAGSARPQRVG
ncbi:MAG TPA: DUF6632 domain-containing protein, partial [Thermoanaerobaculia bacterium]